MPEGIRSLLLRGRPFGRGKLFFKAVFFRKIPGYQCLQKRESAGAVRQRMKHFENDSALEITYAVEQIPSAGIVQHTAGALMIFLHFGAKTGTVQIVPEEALAKNDIEMVVFAHRLVERVLQSDGVYRLRELADDAEDAGVAAVRGRRNDFGGIIQFVPCGKFGHNLLRLQYFAGTAKVFARQCHQYSRLREVRHKNREGRPHDAENVTSGRTGGRNRCVKGHGVWSLRKPAAARI